MLKITRKPKEEVKVEEIKEETKMNVFKTVKGWSLKKKLLVGAGVIAAPLLGAFAYGKMNQNESEDEDDFDDENREGYESEEDEDERDLQELEESEKQENQE